MARHLSTVFIHIIIAIVHLVLPILAARAMDNPLSGGLGSVTNRFILFPIACFFTNLLVEKDIQLLNCALYIEHMESALYTEGLSRFSVKNFTDAGLEPWTYGRFQEILEHEKSHVRFLQNTVSEAGGRPIGPCTYNFSFNDDPLSFVELASELETIGTAAYHGVSTMLTNEQSISASGVVFEIEARHSGWIDASVRKVSAWSGAFGVPLNCGQVLTLLTPYIESCPSRDSELSPLPKPYPPLTISNTRPNELASLSFTPPDNFNTNTSTPESFSVTFLTSNSGVLSVPIDVQDDSEKPIQVRIPENIQGDSFVVITNNAKDVLEESILAGPALLRVQPDANFRDNMER
ncbi:ferritin-like domain-containing protein [Lentinula raphanica]|nr:ferritin-like domain-containing protein [Lentinula raphanica]